MNIFQEFIAISNQMAPYLILGFVLAGVMHVLVPKSMVQQYMGKHSFSSVLYGSLLGVPLPLCSCGVLPTAIAFRKQGASPGATVSFLISTPQTGVDSIVATYSLLGLPYAIARPIIAFISGIFGGILTNTFREPEKPKPLFTLDIPKPACEKNCGCEQTVKKKQSKITAIFQYAFVDFIEDIGKWILIGLILATAVSLLIPDDFFTSVSTNPLVHIAFVLMLSVPIYTCATGSIPVAAALLLKGISPGAALVFLMAGPATSIASITVLSQSVGKRITLMYVSSIILSAVFFGLIIDFVLPAQWFAIDALTHIHIHDESSLFAYISSVLLFIIIGYSFVRKIKR